MKKNAILLLVIISVMFVSCAPSGYSSQEAGFFSGIWHGIIFVFSLIGKLFGLKIGIYAEHNSGFFYWLGFMIGLGLLGGGSAKSRT